MESALLSETVSTIPSPVTSVKPISWLYFFSSSCFSVALLSSVVDSFLIVSSSFVDSSKSLSAFSALSFHSSNESFNSLFAVATETAELYSLIVLICTVIAAVKTTHTTAIAI